MNAGKRWLPPFWPAEMVAVTVFGVAAGLLLAACGGSGGGSSTPASPTPTPTVPVSSACSAVTQASASGAAALDIVNGADCSTANSPVVLLNMKDAAGQQVGACSGTVIAPRAILTAAHCLQPPAASVLVFLGSGPEQPASSFAAHPSWREANPSSFDVGVLLMPADIGRPPKPLLLSRDAHVGETAVLSGWGKDTGVGVTATLRAGVATITAVAALTLQTTSTASGSAVCQGDSGGALFVQDGDTWSLAGVISANTTLACSSGDNFYASVRAAENMSFILGRVPDASRR